MEKYQQKSCFDSDGSSSAFVTYVESFSYPHWYKQTKSSIINNYDIDTVTHTKKRKKQKAGLHWNVSPPKLLSGHLISTEQTDLSKLCRGRMTQVLFSLGGFHQHSDDLKATQQDKENEIVKKQFDDDAEDHINKPLQTDQERR